MILPLARGQEGTSLPSSVLRLLLSCNTGFIVLLDGLGLVSMTLLEWNGVGNTGMYGLFVHLRGHRSGMEAV